MHDTAAHLVDRVIPRVPIRQWVLTFAPRVRWHLAADLSLASEALTLFVRALFNFQRRRARRLGIKLPRANASGAITFVQRFGSALQLAVHFHTLVPDGVFVPPPDRDPEARPKFIRLDPPTDEEVEVFMSSEPCSAASTPSKAFAIATSASGFIPQAGRPLMRKRAPVHHAPSNALRGSGGGGMV